MAKISQATQKDLKTILCILNKATLNLHSQGIMQWEFPWEAKEIKQEIQNGWVYLLSGEDKPIGTFFLRDMEPLNFLGSTGEDKYIFRIALLPPFQGKGLGMDIIQYARKKLKPNRSLFLDCWAGNHKLRKIYARAGFTHLGDFIEEDYLISIFKLSNKTRP